MVSSPSRSGCQKGRNRARRQSHQRRMALRRPDEHPGAGVLSVKQSVFLSATLALIGMIAASVSADTIYEAAGRGDLEAVQRFLRSNPQLANSRVPPGVGAPGEEGATPLHAASRNGRLEIVKSLLSQGADVN